MKYARLIFASILISLLSIGGCGNNNGNTNSLLPPDPDQWVCQDSLAGPTPQQIDDFCAGSVDTGTEAPLQLQNPPPISDLDAKNAYDLAYNEFLMNREYASVLGWIGDLTWRMTGPYVGEIGSGETYGTHPVVKVYYSPEIIEWMCNGRQGEIPDGAMIIKEMHSIDEELDITINNDGCMIINADVPPESWTVMIKQKGASHDGWYWGFYSITDNPAAFAWQSGNPPIFDASAITGLEFLDDGAPPSEPDPLWYPTGYVFSSANKIPNVVFPYNGYGNYCVNCHASAVSESTFVAFDNILTPGILFKRYSSTELPQDLPDELEDGHFPGLISLTSRGSMRMGAGEVSRGAGDEVDGYDSPFTTPLKEPSPAFLEFYDQLDPVSFTEAWSLRLPAETYDHVVSSPAGPEQFITSNQCTGCHDAAFSNASMPNMLLEQEINGRTELINLSPYGEWKASPMGLAGRDPIFFSQLQSETNNLPEYTECIENTCLHCHGVMGQRQLAIDTLGQDTAGCENLFALAPPPGVPFGKPFRLDMVTHWPNAENNEQQKYGALARDGISCAVCHHVSDVDLGNEESFTGNFVTGPPDEIYGPYTDDKVAPLPMEHAIGVTPEFRDYFVGGDASSSNMCGSCHNILLPVFTNEGELTGASYEQSTHLEWVNSDFAPGRPDFLSCADCHMSTTYDGQHLSFKIANIESSDFAPTTERLPDEEITLTGQDTFARHSIHGLNLFINQLFQQFPVLLGYRQIDFMTASGPEPPLITAVRSLSEIAQMQTAALDVQTLEVTPGGQLKAVVKVTNKAGHYLPSGVGFRRVFVEFLVRDAEGNVLWASGRTNDLGVIVEGTTDAVLPSEQPVKFPEVPFQPHYQTITQEDQVQIYQELIEDSDGNLTTSFLRRAETVKDNRLRPRGYDPELFLTFSSPYIQELAETYGEAAFDPYYTDPDLTGADVIEYLVTLDPGTLARVHDVQVTLYNQSIPPFYLQDRFNDAHAGPGESSEIDRLYYMTSHLDTDEVTDDEGRQILKDWKLFITSATKVVE